MYDPQEALVPAVAAEERIFLTGIEVGTLLSQQISDRDHCATRYPQVHLYARMLHGL